MPNARIIVVDDEAHITHVVSLKLRNAGYDVQTACDGEEAFELVSRDPPDLLITDLQMPYMSGLELCAKLREQPSTANVPALMLTARGYSLASSELTKTNIKQVMSKPFSPRKILETVEELLGGTPSLMEAT